MRNRITDEQLAAMKPREMKTSRLLVSLYTLGMIESLGQGDDALLKSKVTEIQDEIDRRLPGP